MKSKGTECVNNMKNLFVEGCANLYYKDMEEVQRQAQQIIELEKLVSELNSYMDSDDKEHYDFTKFLQNIKEETKNE